MIRDARDVLTADSRPPPTSVRGRKNFPSVCIRIKACRPPGATHDTGLKQAPNMRLWTLQSPGHYDLHQASLPNTFSHTKKAVGSEGIFHIPGDYAILRHDHYMSSPWWRVVLQEGAVVVI